MHFTKTSALEKTLKKVKIDEAADFFGTLIKHLSGVKYSNILNPQRSALSSCFSISTALKASLNWTSFCHSSLPLCVVTREGF